MIEISEDSRHGWRVLTVAGRADAIGGDELQNRLCAAIQTNMQVAVDFSAVDYISSCGLRAVLHAAREAEDRTVRFAGCSPSAQVKKVFDISGLHHIMEIHGELPC
jgi:anti-sigma B factor antagonist